MNIIAPYVSEDYSVHVEEFKDTTDKVERSGYVSPEKKIKAYLESGTVLQSIRTGGEQYEIQGEETELDEDSPEFVEELTSVTVAEPFPIVKVVIGQFMPVSPVVQVTLRSMVEESI